MGFLLQGTDFVIEIIWLAIILLAGFFTWVKKIIEKKMSEGREGEPGKKVDVGSAVRAQIEKYMRAAEGSRIGRQVGAIPEAEAPPPRPAAPPVARPAPRPVPAAEAVREIEKKIVRPAPAAPGYASAFKTTTPAALSLRARTRRRAQLRLTKKNVKAAIVLAEVMGPPVGMRSDYRLF